MNAFIKQEGKLNGDCSIQKSLLTLAKDVINAEKTGRKKIAGTIPISMQDKFTNTEMLDPARWEDNIKNTNGEEDIGVHKIPTHFICCCG